MVFFFEEHGFYITFNLFSDTFSALKSWVCINHRESVPHTVSLGVRMAWVCFFNYRSNKGKNDGGNHGVPLMSGGGVHLGGQILL